MLEQLYKDGNCREQIPRRSHCMYRTAGPPLFEILPFVVDLCRPRAAANGHASCQPIPWFRTAVCESTGTRGSAATKFAYHRYGTYWVCSLQATSYA